MNDILITVAKKMSKTNKRKLAWRNVVRTMAMVIIFCTTYALILPAITMQSDPICGMEEHVHSDECYEVIQLDTLTCTIPESEGHTHSDACCTIPESEGHAHSDDCCTTPESEEHSHGEECCTIPEAEAHSHSDDCCTIPEGEGHTHGDECWTHTEEIGSELICAMAEHTHTDICYPLETEPTGDEGFNCGYAQHTHHEKCKDDCNIVEHTHEASCILDRVDLNADVESDDDWEQMAEKLELTGHWAQDLLILAKSQKGYKESDLNVVLSDEELHGYTRYGDWYGNPYQSWGNLYIAFCLNYAGVSDDDIPRSSDTGRWQAALEEKGLLQKPDENQIQSGSVIFWKGDDGKIVSSVVVQVEKEGSSAAKTTYRVISGDVNGQVDYQVVKTKNIVAVCDLEKAQLQSQGIAINLDDPEVTEPEATEPEETEPEATEPEATEPEETEPEVTEPEATEPEETEPEVTEPEATEPEETEPEATEAEGELKVFTAETENYIVTVTCPAELDLPRKAELRVSEYDKDSETYIRRCEEVGYELEWLLNIGFYKRNKELHLNGEFQVEVTSKQGQVMSEEITHFADAGTEKLEGDVNDESVSFTSDGFSDFGGGNPNSRAASDVYTFKTVDVVRYNNLNLKTGTNYVAYVIQNGQIIFLSSSGDALQPIFVSNVNGTTTANAEWSVSVSQMGSNASNFTWQLVSNSGNNYLATQNGSKRLELYNGWCTLGNGTPIQFQDNGTGAEVGSTSNNQTYELRYADANDGNYIWRASWYNNNGQLSTGSDTVYFAEIITSSDVPSTPDVTYPNYPHSVHTGEIDINRRTFYNLCEKSGLAGCVFEITGPNGYTATLTSTSSTSLQLPEGMPEGTYTITEVSVPDGYIRDTNYQRQFKIDEDGNLVTGHTIGTFINYEGAELTNSKTAEVEDYANRIYKVTMTAKSNLRRYVMDPIDVQFVVDQSNSMLFPSKMNSTGYTVELSLNGYGNAAAMDAVMNKDLQDNLDRSQVYYVIADPQGTSTVWAIWHDGHGWMCQDASYYAKAKHNNEEGYKDPAETVRFPTYGNSYTEQQTADNNAGATPKYKSNGGSLDKSLSGGSLGKYIDNQEGDKKTFVLYTADNEYNRLHYLQESLANIIYQLADANGNNRVSVTEFNKVLGDCEGPHLLSTHADTLVNMVTNINTTGGTRQDKALEHIYKEHLTWGGKHYASSQGFAGTYTLLITDGAPVESKDVDNNDMQLSLGGYNSPPTTTYTQNDTVYGRIRGWAAQVRSKTTLMTVALGMQDVETGSKVLKEIASDEEFFGAMEDASELNEFVQKLLFESIREKGLLTVTGDIVDEISESFYPIAWVNKGAAGQRKMVSSDNNRDWVLLNAGDWITLDGKLTSANASNAAGQLLQREDGTYYVQWNEQTISGTNGWQGIVYVKAKEDFIGGNAIDTNKAATLTAFLNNDENNQVVRQMETPTVNVHLLGLNENHSSVTVYLGDWVNGEGSAPIDSLMGFYDATYFTKLFSDGTKPINKVSVGSDDSDGLEDAIFYLRYAMGRDLTGEEWTLLQNGDTITIPYIYDDASSHGNVGYFTFSLKKTGNSNYAGHEAHTACQPGGTPSSDECESPAETYTLKVVYTAYELGEAGRPEENVHNGSRGPGYEVGTGTRLNNGLGVLEKNNIHEVHVISGKIEIWKYFDEGVTDSEERTFTFSLNKIVDGEITVVDTQTITIPANATAGSEKITFDNLSRGTYTVTEAEDDLYTVKNITVLSTTNCESVPEAGESAMELVFVMGNNTSKENVIGFKQTGDRYTSYVDPVNGVYGEAVFTNGIKIVEAEISVEKIWVDSETAYEDEVVYVALYQNGQPVYNSDGHLRVLKLSAENGWKGSFTVSLADANKPIEEYNFSIRELAQVVTESREGWATGILEGSENTLVYYDKALEQGELLHISGKAYLVDYATDEEGQLTVTNSRMFELPHTGAMGTKMYTISGLLLILAAALIFGFRQRRNKKGGKVV